MTRERAIEELKDIKSVYANRELGELRLMRSEVQALDMAIQSLSQEPCDDAISREAVVQTIEDAKNAGELTFARTIKRIMDLPSVTQKSGKWITTRTFMHDGEYYCDRCKCDAPNNEKWNYCPNCGAKMESETETWNGYHGQITAPKGTFKKIYEDAESEDKE